jgi:hypothetical protein
MGLAGGFYIVWILTPRLTQGKKIIIVIENIKKEKKICLLVG